MKLILLSVLCLSLLLSHINFSFALKKKSKSPSRDSTSTKTNSGHRNDKGSTSHGGRPNPPQSGRPGNTGGYPHRPGDGGYYNQNPASHGGYGGRYMNRNPANRIASPHYSSDFGYGGYGAGGGSPFSRSVYAMGVYPSDKSRSFGGIAVAAAGGALAGTAVGYGLGSAPHPQFELRSPQEEYYYKQYMRKKSTTQNTGSTATKTSRQDSSSDPPKENSYSDPPRETSYSGPPQSYDTFMESCMKQTENQSKQPNNKSTATPTTTQAAAPSASDNSTGSNNTAADNSSTSALSTPHHANQPKTNPVSPASQNLTNDDDDTVSIEEIGYPALIKQQNLRRCLEMYMGNIDYLRTKGGVQGLEMGSQKLLTVVTSTILMLVNSNMLMLLHRGP